MFVIIFTPCFRKEEGVEQQQEPKRQKTAFKYPEDTIAPEPVKSLSDDRIRYFNNNFPNNY